MNIEEVITRTILAIYSSHSLSKRLVLKGGSAIRLFEGIDSRLSVDADFSIQGTLGKDADSVFKEIMRCLTRAFGSKGYEVIDFKHVKRPQKRRADFPAGWGGWGCEFKLVDRIHRDKSLEAKRRHALIPEGSNTTKVIMDLSEHEYCGTPKTKALRGTIVRAYSRELLVLEKLRALCQQHPAYPYRQEAKNRARDFYDIWSLTTDIKGPFIRQLPETVGCCI